jgi:hypothetical protein
MNLNGPIVSKLLLIEIEIFLLTWILKTSILGSTIFMFYIFLQLSITTGWMVFLVHNQCSTWLPAIGPTNENWYRIWLFFNSEHYWWLLQLWFSLGSYTKTCLEYYRIPGYLLPDCGNYNWILEYIDNTPYTKNRIGFC